MGRPRRSRSTVARRTLPGARTGWRLLWEREGSAPAVDLQPRRPQRREQFSDIPPIASSVEPALISSGPAEPQAASSLRRTVLTAGRRAVGVPGSWAAAVQPPPCVLAYRCPASSTATASQGEKP